MDRLCGKLFAFRTTDLIITPRLGIGVASNLSFWPSRHRVIPLGRKEAGRFLKDLEKSVVSYGHCHPGWSIRFRFHANNCTTYGHSRRSRVLARSWREPDNNEDVRTLLNRLR